MVRDRGWACSEWVGAGAAGEARAAEGVAGESSMLPCDDAGLSMVFSCGRYCTHCFLLRAEKSGGGARDREGRWRKNKLAEPFLSLHFQHCQLPIATANQKWETSDSQKRSRPH